MAREILPDPNREYGQFQSKATLDGSRRDLAAQQALNKKTIDEAKQMGDLLMQGLTATRAKNVRNLASTFSARYVSFQETFVEGKGLNLSARENIEEAFTSFDWKVRYFGISLLLIESAQALLSNLRSQSILDFDPMIIAQIPRWAKIPLIPSTRELGQEEKINEVLYFFNLLANEAKQPPKSEEKRAERYGKIADGFTRALAHEHASSLMVFFRTFLLASTEDSHVVLKLNGFESSQKILVKQMYELFDNFLLDSYKALIDDDDINHQASVNFFRAFITAPVDSAPWDQRTEIIARGAMLRGILLDIDSLIFFRSMRTFAQDSDEPLYGELARHMEEALLDRQDFVPVEIKELQKLFPADQDAEPVDWERFKQNIELLRLGEKTQTLQAIEATGFAKKMDNYSGRLKMIDGTLYAQFFFVHDSEIIRKNVQTINLDDTGFTTAIIAIDLTSSTPSVYLNVIDDETENPALEAHFLSKLSALVDAMIANRQGNTTDTNRESVENALASMAPVQIHTLAPKGPEQMKRSNPERIRRQEEKKAKKAAVTVESAPRTFEEHVTQQKNKPKFFLTSNMEAQIEKDYPGYAERVKGKLKQANKGGGIVKTYSLVPGPRADKPVWSIRLTPIIRILAQEDDVAKEAKVFALLTHKEVEDLYTKK